jgi:hypothetical protein
MSICHSILPTLLPALQLCHRNLLGFALALSRRRRQRRDLPQHAGNNRRVRSFAAYLVGAAYNLLRIAKLCPSG